MNKDMRQWLAAFRGVKFDQGGASYSDTYKEYVKILRMNNFKYTNWPFQDQTPEELEDYLYEYQAVAVFKVQEDNFFIPVQLSKKINKLNNKLVTVTHQGEFNKNIIKAFDLNKKEYKEAMPFIFDNAGQVAPHQLQSRILGELAGVFNANKSNRINKNKQAIVEVENGQSLATAARLNLESDDYSPFTIIEKGRKEKDNPMSNLELKQLTNGVMDMYNSFSTEKKDLIKELMVINGIRSSQSGDKSSAQETDNQTSDKDRDTANFLLAMIKSRRKSLKNIRKYLGVSIQVTFTDATKRFMDAALTEEQKKAIEEEKK